MYFFLPSFLVHSDKPNFHAWVIGLVYQKSIVKFGVLKNLEIILFIGLAVDG